MKRGLFLMIGLLFVSSISMAQRVITDANNRCIIDARRMPGAAITKTAKARTTDATTYTLGINNLTNLSSEESNKTVSRYFEVMKTDLNSGAKMFWLEGYDNCKNYDSGDGNKTWRLPTERELMLIWILHKSLIKKAGFTAFLPALYMTATEINVSRIKNISFINGIINNGGKIIKYNVRCIRDLTPPAK